MSYRKKEIFFCCIYAIFACINNSKQNENNTPGIDRPINKRGIPLPASPAKPQGALARVKAMHGIKKKKEINPIKRQNLINELFPQYIEGKLDRKARHDDYIQLLEALNAVIRDARKKRRFRNHPNDPSAIFLFNHFKPLIEGIIFSLFNKFFSLKSEARREGKDDLKKSALFNDYLKDAREIFISEVLGATSPISYSIRFDSNKNRLIGRGKGKVNKQPFHLRFVADTPESEEAAASYAKKFKAYTSKQNPFFDEPAVYDPDYMEPALREVIFYREMSDQIIRDWKAGEYPEFKTETECKKWIKSEFKPIEKNKKDNTGRNPTNFITWLCGIGKNPGQRGILYERLRQIAKRNVKDEKNYVLLNEDVYLDGIDDDPTLYEDKFLDEVFKDE
jgi:hypothetical protein